MILTEAKKRARDEYEEVLARSGRTADQLRARETARMRRSTYRVPHLGAAGTAANYALHLADADRRPRSGLNHDQGVGDGDGAVCWQDYMRHDTKQAEMMLGFLARMESECGLTPGRDRVSMTVRGRDCSRRSSARKWYRRSLPCRQRSSGCIPM